MKLTLPKKKPLKITAGAPSGEPDPSQTTVKTVYDLREKKGDQPIRGTINIAQSGSGEPRGGETPPIGGRKPPHEGENGKPDRPSRRRGVPIEMVIQMAMVVQMEMKIQEGMENHPGEGKSPLEGMGNQVEVVEDQTHVMIMGVEMDPPLLH